MEFSDKADIENAQACCPTPSRLRDRVAGRSSEIGQICSYQGFSNVVFTCEYNTNKHPSKVSASKTRLYGTCMAQSGCAMHVPCMCHAVPYNVPCMCHTYRQHTFFTGGPIQCILINTIFTYIHRRDHIYRLYETDFFRHSI